MWFRRKPIVGPVCQCQHPWCMHYPDGHHSCGNPHCWCKQYVGPAPTLTEMEEWAKQVVKGKE